MAVSQKPRNKSHKFVPISTLVGFVVSIDPSKGIQKVLINSKGELERKGKSEISRTFTRNEFLDEMPSIPIDKKLEKKERDAINSKRSDKFVAAINLAKLSAEKYKSELMEKYLKITFT